MCLYQRSAAALVLATSLVFGYDKQDIPEGWASQAGGTTGGQGGTEVTVSSIGELSSAVGSSGKKIILVRKGEYKGSLGIKSDKTILGLEPGVILHGRIRIGGASNIILRNIAIIDSKCSSYNACRSGGDAVYIGGGAHHIWFDHVDISDGQDGNCDVTNGPDFLTFTWCKFWYSYPKEHAFSNLIAAGDGETGSRGKLNMTFAYCWWGDNVQQRQPRGRFGKIHVLNNLYTSARSEYNCGPGHEMEMLIENNAFLCPGKAVNPIGAEPHNWKTVGNIGTATGLETNQGAVFTPPYALSLKMDASQVEARVRSWAGNVMTLGQTDPASAKTPRGSGNRTLLPKLYVDGRRLVNAGPAAHEVTAMGIDGKTRVPVLRIEAGHALALPLSAPGIIFRIEGEGGAAYVLPGAYSGTAAGR